jgi:hypothetical protein
MNLRKILLNAKEKIISVPDRLALRILILVEREPAQDEAVVLSSSPWDTRGPYLRYTARIRARRNPERRELSKEETVA